MRETSDLAALRKIGRVPRFLAAAHSVFVAFLCTISADAWLWWFMVIPLGALVLSFRVRSWVADGTIHIRSYLRTHHFLIADLDLVVDAEYNGWWTLGQPADLIGIAQIDFCGDPSSVTEVIPATMCTVWTARRIVAELNELIETENATAT
ncbi:hypothetical protein FVO59_01905 [Microbacterium esteraromaticum]|uniref:Uncharacterized protein n=1 Tax=Microbacterium esteraromaticum TaxID=57043 RepID=A0A7D8AHE2_9MICO|nr:hypothetical protein [Microbacterium esteraromaticum]QMU96085.1 hypothetical protein FVO59_01905 [Microbacterium esteraromaticum]